MAFTLGVDLGKAQDPTALAIIEPQRPTLHLRYLERLALGTPYPVVIEHIAGLLERPPLNGRTRLVVDATGVGAPVVDDMREAGLEPVAVVITSGKHIRRVDGAWRVPKQALVGGLVSAFEGGWLKVAEGLEYGDALIRELQDFKVTITSAKNATYGGASEHDDLVIAAALAVWRAPG